MNQKVMNEYIENADEDLVYSLSQHLENIGLDGLAEALCVVFDQDRELSVGWGLDTLIGSLNEKKRELFQETIPEETP